MDHEIALSGLVIAGLFLSGCVGEGAVLNAGGNTLAGPGAFEAVMQDIRPPGRIGDRVFVTRYATPDVCVTAHNRGDYSLGLLLIGHPIEREVRLEEEIHAGETKALCLRKVSRVWLVCLESEPEGEKCKGTWRVDQLPE